jgi:hypothetical protein
VWKAHGPRCGHTVGRCRSEREGSGQAMTKGLATSTESTRYIPCPSRPPAPPASPVSGHRPRTLTVQPSPVGVAVSIAISHAFLCIFASSSSSDQCDQSASADVAGEPECPTHLDRAVERRIRSERRRRVDLEDPTANGQSIVRPRRTKPVRCALMQRAIQGATVRATGDATWARCPVTSANLSAPMKRSAPTLQRNAPDPTEVRLGALGAGRWPTA